MGRGRPTDYKPEYCERAEALCAKHSLTDEDLALMFGVCVASINNWKTQHPEFLESLKKGKDTKDNAVEKSLFERATGYQQEAVKIFCQNGMVTEVPYIERFPPDTTACIFWLKNRQPDKWRDKREFEGKVEAALPQIIYEEIPKSAD
jgi:hypothetical protein